MEERDSVSEKESLIKKNITLRRVRRDDCALIWEWENEPDVRSASFSSEPIPWEQHVRWFETKITDKNCFLYMAIDEQQAPIGRVRFERHGKEAVISVVIAKNYRGMHYGTMLIEMASHKLFEITDICRINAYIKIDNDQSIRAFENAGYKAHHQVELDGHPAIELTFTNRTKNECHNQND